MQLPFLTLSSGQILNAYTIKGFKGQHPLGDLSIYQTDDGSISLHNSIFNEGFHCSTGALQEAQDKFLKPSQLDKFKSSTSIGILDVCVGMGYNTACIIEHLIKESNPFEWWGLELDSRPIELGINNPYYKKLWSQQVQEILLSLHNNGLWENKKNRGKVIWGDARIMLTLIPIEVHFDLILLDAFSPSKCPMLWSEEFLIQLSKRLVPGGKLLTYCTAAAIRGSLKRAGLQVASLKPLNTEKRKWSNGTIAIATTKISNKITQELIWAPLNEREEEHLLTKAAVPYRDPTSNGSSQEIIQRREKEQKDSNLEPTNDWKRRWRKTQ